MCRCRAAIDESRALQTEQRTDFPATFVGAEPGAAWDSWTCASSTSGDRNADPHCGQIASDSSYSTNGTGGERGRRAILLSAGNLAAAGPPAPQGAKGGPVCPFGPDRSAGRAEMTDWANLAIWSLIGTWVLVVGTLVLMYWQTRSNQHLNSANSVMALRERFDGARMRAARRHLSERLLKQEHHDIASMEVVTFFELVGTLTHRKVLDDDLVWEAFGTWVTAYYIGLRQPVDLIAQIRTDLRDPLVFHEFEWLYERLRRIDAKESGAPAEVPADTLPEASRVLTRESKLESI